MKKYKKELVATVITSFGSVFHIHTSLNTTSDENRHVNLICTCRKNMIGSATLEKDDYLIAEMQATLCMHLRALLYPVSDTHIAVNITQRGHDILDWREAARALLK